MKRFHRKWTKKYFFHLRHCGMADMHIILWSVISDQWFSKIEVFKFFLKICQPLEFLLRSAIRDPQLIFVFAILIKRDFLARQICIWFCDPWSVIYKIEFLKFFSKFASLYKISLRSAIRDPHLIFVFWLRETFWQGWYAYDSVIRDPWSVTF